MRKYSAIIPDRVSKTNNVGTKWKSKTKQQQQKPPANWEWARFGLKFCQLNWEYAHQFMV